MGLLGNHCMKNANYVQVIVFRSPLHGYFLIPAPEADFVLKGKNWSHFYLNAAQIYSQIGNGLNKNNTVKSFGWRSSNKWNIILMRKIRRKQKVCISRTCHIVHRHFLFDSQQMLYILVACEKAEWNWVRFDFVWRWKCLNAFLEI